MMGTKIPADIRYTSLTEAHHEEPGESAHSPYTDALIRLVVTDGVDPSGREIDSTMPRWQLSDEEFNDLLAYLKTLR